MPLLRKLRVFWSMNASDRLTIVEAIALPICISSSFRLLGVPRTQALLRRWAMGGDMKRAMADPIASIRDARRAQRIVKRSTGIEGNCLVRSLTLWAILLRRGLSTDLRVGFRKRDGRIEGHAWLEHGNTPVNENIDEARTFEPHEQPVSFDLWRRVGQDQSTV